LKISKRKSISKIRNINFERSDLRSDLMKLKKEITFLGVFSIAIGAMISSGIFILPGLY